MPGVIGRARGIALFSGTLLLGIAADASPVQRREVHQTAPVRPGMTVSLENLVGKVSIEGTGGAELELTGWVNAEGSSDEETKKLLAALQVGVDTQGSKVAIVARYPVDEHDTFHYPGREREDHPGFLLNWLDDSRSTVRYQGRKVTIVSGRRRHTPTLWADLKLRVPAGVVVEASNSVGLLNVFDVKGDVSVKTDSGDIHARGGSGALRAETGSGDVFVKDRDGDVALSTGSGDVEVAHVHGAARLSTGSGDVKLKDVEGAKVSANTGSGDISLDAVSAALDLETGSGDIQATHLAGSERLRGSTASGNIQVEGDLTRVRDAKLSTSSGDVRLTLTRAVPMHLEATTVSGDIDVNLPNLRTTRQHDHELVADVDGGGAQFRIETVSGSVVVAER